MDANIAKQKVVSSLSGPMTSIVTFFCQVFSTRLKVSPAEQAKSNQRTDGDPLTVMSLLHEEAHLSW